MNRLRVRQGPFLGLLLLLIAGCSDRPHPPGMIAVTQSAPAETVRPASIRPTVAPFDLAATLRRLQFGFRPDSGAFVGGQRDYRSRIDDRGRLTITPRVPTSRSRGKPGADGSCSFETRSIVRGGAALGRSAAPALRDDGSVAIDRAVAVEHLRNTARGVSQSWSFAGPPAGRGDLAIHIAVGGPRHVDTTRGGHHFASSGAIAGVRYGTATWIDAAGRRSPLPVRHAAGVLTIAVGEATLASSTYPAVLDPVISAEQGIDEPVLTPAEDKQHLGAVASNGAGFLFVWEDLRSGAAQVYGALLAADGSLQSSAFAIASVAGLSGIAVASDGTDYLVVWTMGKELRSARVSSSGEVLDQPAVELSSWGPQPVSFAQPRVAYGADRYAVFFMHSHPSSGYTTTRTLFVSKSNALLGYEGWGVNEPPGNPIPWGGVSFIGPDRFLVMAGSLGALVDAADGSVLAPGPFPITPPTATGTPALVFDGLDTLVVWSDDRDGTNEIDVYGRRVGAGGGLGAEFPIATAAGRQVLPAVAQLGTESLVVWSDEGLQSNGPAEIRATRIDASDNVLDGAVGVLLAEAPATDAAVAASSEAFLVGWTDGWGDLDIVARPVTVEGEPGPSLLLTTQTNQQRDAAVSFNGTDYLVVWSDSRNEALTSSDIHAARLSSEGEVLDPESLVVGQLGAAERSPSVASDGTGWLVAWRVSSEIVVNTVGGDGFVEPLTGPVFDPSDPPALSSPAVAFDGTQYLVVWRRQTCQGMCLPPELLAMHVSATGTPSIPFTIEPNPAEVSAPTAIGLAEGALVVWSLGEVGDLDLYGARLDPDGNVLPAFPISTAPADQSAPAAAFGGENALVVWRDARSGGSEIFGARIAADDSVLDPHGLPISQVTLSAAPDVAHADDSSYLVAWEGSIAGAPAEIFGAWVRQDGTSADDTDTPLTESDVAVESPALAAPGGGVVLLAYQRQIEELEAPRVRARFVSSGLADGQSCSVEEDCVSRVCEDGVCCASACGECETCAQSPGVCTPVTNGDDDTCFGAHTCDAVGDCTLTAGQLCSSADECASGHCVDGFCCHSACAGTCDSCDATGQCTTVDCTPYACNEDGGCWQTCDSSAQCAPGFLCKADRTCQPPEATPAPQDGCGCRLAAARQPLSTLAWLATLALALGLVARPHRR